MPVLISVIVFVLVCLISRKKSIVFKQHTSIVLSMFTLSVIICRSIYRFFYTFDEDWSKFLHEGLPLHTCHLIPIVTLYGAITLGRKWLALGYFLCMTTNLMAIITPELYLGYPDLEYFCFFLIHGSILITTLYNIAILNLRTTFSNVLFSVFWTNIYLLFALIINYQLESNYGYVMHKPTKGQLMKHFGEWPNYLLTLEIMGILLFYSFHIINKLPTESVEE